MPPAVQPLAFLLILLAAPLARAQFTRGDAIKATTTVHSDGTRSTMLVNPETQSAEAIYYDLGGKVTQKIVYPLDGQNQPVGSVSYNAKGAIVAKSSYVRDGSGRISEETLTAANGQFLRKRVYSYSTKNKISRVDEYDANGVLLTPPRAAVPDKKRKR